MGDPVDLLGHLGTEPTDLDRQQLTHLFDRALVDGLGDQRVEAYESVDDEVRHFARRETVVRGRHPLLLGNQNVASRRPAAAGP